MTLAPEAPRPEEKVKTDTSKVENIPWYRRKTTLAVGAAATGVAITAGVFLGINSNKESAPANPQSNSDTQPGTEENGVLPPEDNNEVIPVQTTKTPEAVETNLQKVRLADLKDMDFSSYREVSRQDTLLYASDKMDNPPSETVYFLDEENAATNPEMLSDYNPNLIASIDNDGNEIMQQHLFMLQTALAQRTEDSSSKLIDKDEAKKVLDGAFYYSGDEPTVSNEYISKYNYIDGMDEIILMQDRYYVTDTSELKTGTDRNGNQVTYKDVSYTDNIGVSYVGRYAFTGFENENGEAKNMWQQVSTALPEEASQLDKNM
jgi:hypothetical protein